ncbi:MAG TPA: protein translocase subunit SecF [Azospirillaceae bacterium]|nr:protein translocase subunit SecF [Azospirillaceae bacterium]
MRLLRLVPDGTNIDFVSKRFVAFAFTGALFVATILSLLTQGLNLGIDFRGGILIEVQAPQSIDTGALRSQISGLNLGAVELQQFGQPNDALIRLQQQEGGEAANRAAVQKVRDNLGTGYEYRRIELVGPKVGGELLRDGLIATALAILGITLYVAFRFEWQFGIAALIATFHDVAVTAGLFSIFQLEFDLTSVAALLTLAGYSINDTVVVFDRIRETLRRHKSVDMKWIVNDSVNATLSRTILTSGTTLVAILPFLLFGGHALYTFTLALTFGILMGTYSSIFVAGSILLYLKPLRGKLASPSGTKEATAAGEGR